MQTRYIPAIIMLLAGAVTSVISILNRVDTLNSLIRLLVVLIVFYFIGLIAKSIIEKVNKSRDISLNSEQEEQIDEDSADDSSVTAEEEDNHE